MFTGIVEELGEVESPSTDLGDRGASTVRSSPVTSDVAHGDSIASTVSASLFPATPAARSPPT